MNSFGQRFRFTSYGESHGHAVGGIIDGCPAGIRLDTAFINSELSRRRGGLSPLTTARKEPDRVEFLSGLFEGKTLGTPISFMIRNEDADADAYSDLQDWFRPGHADYTYWAKYGERDWRGGGRSSGRETAARVVAGAIARQLPSLRTISFDTCVEQGTVLQPSDDTIGGIVKCSINGVPAGVGDPIFGRLNASLAAAMMSIPSAMGFEMGAGFASAQMKGSEFADAWSEWKENHTTAEEATPLTNTNHCGGVQGGISNGMPVVFKVAFHPVVSRCDALTCRNKEGETSNIRINGRHDKNHLLRIPVIVESMAALVLADLMI